MFGGWGFYCDDLFFAIVADDTLYLKADADSAEHFPRRRRHALHLRDARRQHADDELLDGTRRGDGNAGRHAAVGATGAGRGRACAQTEEGAAMTDTPACTGRTPTASNKACAGARKPARHRRSASSSPTTRPRPTKPWKLTCEGTALLYRGDFQNARQLLQAMGRRAEKKPKKAANMTEAFHQHRMAQAQRARTLGLLLILVDGDYRIPLRRAPEVGEACREAWGEADGQPPSSRCASCGD